MRFLVLGATGPSGVLFIREALSVYQSCTIVVYARNPQKLPPDLASHASLVIIKGELTDADALSKALEGVDAVLSALGPGEFHPSGTPLAKAHLSLISQMRKQGVRRLICLGTASIRDPDDKSSIIFSILINGVSLLAKNAYRDIVGIGEAVRGEGKDLDWTIVRVPLLNNKENREVIAGYVGDGKIGTTLSRKGFAKFVIEEVENREWVHKAPMISSA